MIQPFTYYNPTKLVFGEGRIAELSRLIDPHYRILLVIVYDAMASTMLYAKLWRDAR